MLLTKSRNENVVTDELLSVLQLIRSENVGPSSFIKLIEIYGNAKEALGSIDDLARIGGLKRKLKLCPKPVAEKEFADTEKFGGKIIPYHDANYPKRLLRISDFPPVLITKGNLKLLNQDIISIVGSRNASLNGQKIAEKLARDFAKYNLVVASGLARGIDRAAHIGSLDNGTIGVIASGISHIYPPENKALFEELFEKGIVITEYSFGTKPLPQNFLQRNRIISGIALAVIVVEASLKSGSLATARHANEQGREVFAVPGSPLDSRAMGTNSLLKKGANILEDAQDAMNIIENIRRKENHLCENEHIFSGSRQIYHIDEKILQEVRQGVITSLSASAISIDELCNFYSFPSQIVQRIILELELAGRIDKYSGGKVALKY